MIELRKVDENNVWKLLKLSVHEEQENFVATNTQSIVEAYTTLASGGVALPFGIYDDDEPVGFVMFGFGTTGDGDEPSVADGNYCIWRFMIDKRYQGKGFGKAALRKSIDYARTFPCGAAKKIWLSYEPENVGAKALYESLGFRENGEMCGEEVVSVLNIE